eukprot:jgi/Mesvir1/28583/Mv00998-RA.1
MIAAPLPPALPTVAVVMARSSYRGGALALVFVCLVLTLLAWADARGDSQREGGVTAHVGTHASDLSALADAASDLARAQVGAKPRRLMTHPPPAHHERRLMAEGGDGKLALDASIEDELTSDSGTMEGRTDASNNPGSHSGEGACTDGPCHGYGRETDTDKRLRVRLALREAALAKEHQSASAHGSTGGALVAAEVEDAPLPCIDCGPHGNCVPLTQRCLCHFGFHGRQCERYGVPHCERYAGHPGGLPTRHLATATQALGVHLSCTCLAELEAAWQETGNGSSIEETLSRSRCFVRLPLRSTGHKQVNFFIAADPMKYGSEEVPHVHERQYSGVMLEGGTFMPLPDDASWPEGDPHGQAPVVEASPAEAVASMSPDDRYLVIPYSNYRKRGASLVQGASDQDARLAVSAADLARIAEVGWAGDCSVYVSVWAPMVEAINRVGCPPREGCREIEQLRGDAEDALGCDAHAMANDMSWLDLVDPAWVRRGSSYGASEFASLREFAEQLAQVRAAQARDERESDATKSLGGCICAPIKNVTALSPVLLQAMLHTALMAQGQLNQVVAAAQEAVDLAGVGDDKEDVIVVGNSGGVEDLPRDTGDVIDTFGTVVRFNSKYFEQLADRVGHKRDMWVMGDYNTVCGCWEGKCCTDEQLRAMRHRMGNKVRLILGVLPFPQGLLRVAGLNKDGSNKLEDVPFRKVSLRAHSHRVLNYWLWQRNMMQPKTRLLRRIHNKDVNLRSGLTTIFMLMIAGVKPTVVGFDVGGPRAMHPSLYHILEYKAGHLQTAPLVLDQYVQETNILPSLSDAGYIKILNAQTLPAIRDKRAQATQGAEPEVNGERRLSHKKVAV